MDAGVARNVQQENPQVEDDDPAVLVPLLAWINELVIIDYWTRTCSWNGFVHHVAATVDYQLERENYDKYRSDSSIPSAFKQSYYLITLEKGTCRTSESDLNCRGF